MQSIFVLSKKSVITVVLISLLGLFWLGTNNYKANKLKNTPATTANLSVVKLVRWVTAHIIKPRL